MAYIPSLSCARNRAWRYASPLSALLFGGFMGSCGDSKQAGASCDPAAENPDSSCIETEVCEQVQGAQAKCFPPVTLQGSVFDLTTSTPIAAARVLARDALGAAASNIAITAMDGTYSLRIPSLRNPDGSVVAANYTLRADASGYQSFPGGVRTALPVAVMGTPTAQGLVISSTLTAIGLAALPAMPRGSIAGSISAPIKSGVLVAGGGSTAISDLSGSFVMFNVMPGPVTVRGYAAGEQLTPAMVTVADGARTEGAILSAASTPLSTVTGSIQFPDPGSCGGTSVLLVLDETFNTTLERGESPRGLRVGNVNGSYTIPSVPDGSYKVLAAFENDNCVRDPSATGGTAIPSIALPAAGGMRTITVTSFKVTGALAVRGPGTDQPDAITSGMPVFTWADDKSENHYELRVYDSLGKEIHSNTAVPGVSGNPDVKYTYPGTPALVPGAYYQFRATSISTGGSALSRTEDLRGVFYLPKP